MAGSSLDNLNDDPILGIADDAEVMEISKLMAKVFIKDEPKSKTSKKKKKKKKSHALKLNFNSLTLNTKSTDPLTLLKRRTNPSKSIISIHENSKNNAENNNGDILKFDDLLGLVNDIEKKHLLHLKEKVDNAKKLNFNENNKSQKHLEKIIYEHFDKSRGLVKKIKNIKNRKKRRRAKYAKQTKSKRYNARIQKQLMAKSRKKRLRRQSLHAW